MNLKPIVSFLIILNLGLIQGNTQTLYKTYFGKDASDASVDLHWHQNGSQLWLNMTIDESEKSTFHSFEAKLMADGTIETAFSDDESRVIKSITKEADELIIEWMTDDTAATVLTSKKDAESILHIISRDEMQMLVADDPASPFALMDMKVLLPEFKSEELNAATRIFFGCKELDSSLEECVQSDLAVFFDQYRELANIPGEKGPSFQWLSSRLVFVVFHHDAIVGIRSAKYVFTGGAHGMQHISYGFFDVENGTQLSLKDVFHEEGFSLLEAVLTDKLKEDIGIEADERLSDAGFFVDSVAPNDNFFITPSGIGFYYNSYELAPYAMGHTTIWLDFVSLKHMLDPDFLKKIQ
jgi:hypothetical protein